MRTAENGGMNFNTSVYADTFLMLLIGGVFLLAGAVKGLVGLGLPTLSMGLLASFMPPAQAAAMLILPSLLTNLWQMCRGPSLWAICRRFWPLQLAIATGTVFAPISLVSLNAEVAAMALGLALLVYALAGLTLPAQFITLPRQTPLSVLAGLATGFITAATGVFVFPAVPFLQALALKKEELVQALGLSFTVSTVALFVRLMGDGIPVWTAATPAWALCLPLFGAGLGMAMGQALRGHASEARFRQLFFWGLLAIGLQMMIRSVLRWTT